MAKLIDTLLLLALPASGKSEVRKYLSLLSPDQCHREFYMGPTVQLDDFPYVHIMRRIDEELAKAGQESIFFLRGDRPFSDPIEWGTLVELLNEDFQDLLAKRVVRPTSAAQHVFDRFEAARQRVGGNAKISKLPTKVQQTLCTALEAEAADLLQKKHAEYPDSLEGKTIVLEFARGGADGSTMPLAAPFGYQYSLGLLSEEILRRSSILYIWVTPEESRRKNDARTDPNDPGSILHHGVPIEVMLKDYGCDDMEYLISKSDKPNTVRLTAHGKTFHLPVARFDNRVDKTSFVREDRSKWKPEQITALHDGLAGAFAKLSQAL
jgi:hypothetical protein